MFKWVIMLVNVVAALLLTASRIDFPPETEVCDDKGWCRPLPSWKFDAAAATDDGAVAISDREVGGLAFFDHGAWQWAYASQMNGSVRRLVRDPDGVLRVLLCGEERCSWQRWQAGILRRPSLGPGEPLTKGVVIKVPKQRLADGSTWRIKRAQLELSRDGGWQPEGDCTASHALSDGPKPTWLCSRYGRNELVQFDGEHVVDVYRSWLTVWLSQHATVFEETAGCAPCLAGTPTVIYRDEAGWHQLRDTPLEHFPTNPVQNGVFLVERIAVTDGGVFAHISNAPTQGRTFKWSEAGWSPAEYDGGWAVPVPKVETVGGLVSEKRKVSFAAGAVLTSDTDFFSFRPWAAFSKGATPTSTRLKVRGVEKDDVLNVRTGPGAGAPLVEALAHDATCLVQLKTQGPTSGWHFVETPSGKQGWVNARYVVVQAASECR